MLAWQPQQLVFFDRVCISQSDPELQREALISLGGILKNSDQMQVLWDSSWAWRLWCAFESAAFLHSRPPVEKTNIRIRPTILGVTLCATWFACFVGGSLSRPSSTRSPSTLQGFTSCCQSAWPLVVWSSGTLRTWPASTAVTSSPCASKSGTSALPWLSANVRT